MSEKYQGMKAYIFICLIGMGFGFVVFSFGFMCGSDDKTAQTDRFLMNADKITVTLDLSYDVPLQSAAGYELKAIYYDLDVNEQGNEVLYVGVNESFEAIVAKIPSGEYNLKLIVLNKSLNLLYESDIIWVTINEPLTLSFLMELRNQNEEEPAE